MYSTRPAMRPAVCRNDPGRASTARAYSAYSRL